jgi:hypothetical protein
MSFTDRSCRDIVRINAKVGWIVFPMRYANHFLEKFPHLHTIASSCYYLGRKAQS